MVRSTPAQGCARPETWIERSIWQRPDGRARRASRRSQPRKQPRHRAGRSRLQRAPARELQFTAHELPRGQATDTASTMSAKPLCEKSKFEPKFVFQFKFLILSTLGVPKLFQRPSRGAPPDAANKRFAPQRRVRPLSLDPACPAMPAGDRGMQQVLWDLPTDIT